VAAAALVLVASFAVPPAPAVAANSTKPPVPAELAGLPQIEVSYGHDVTLQLVGDAPDFEHPVICGELGCVYNSIGWGLPAGSSATAGCGATDISCTFAYRPFGFGDKDEAWQKATVAHLQGSFTVSSQSYALLGTVGKYTAYPDLWFEDGDPDELASGRAIYLVRGGTAPDVSACSADVGDPGSQEIPDCLVISGSSGARNLPEDSTWTVYGTLKAPTSGPVSQVAGFSTTTITVTGDNVLMARVTHVARPTLSVAVTGLPSSIGLNQTAVVHVTVSATGGAGGQINDITFPRGILTSGPGSSLETALQVVSPSVLPAPFSLTSGQSQTFDVTIKGVLARTNVFVSSQASGGTDESQSRTADATTVKTNVVDGDPPPPVDPGDPGDAPAPPVINAATGGAPGLVSGTVTGAPGSTVLLHLATATPSGTCPRLMTGAGISSAGVVTVAIPASGTAPFTHAAAIAPNGWVYGTTVAASKTSDVSACRKVAPASSTVGLKLVKKKVKVGKKGKATVTVAAAGLAPSGTVTVTEGKKVLGRATLTAADHGEVTVTLKKRPKGKHRLTASFAGSADVAGSTSSSVVLTVKGAS
jgi:hypothetical protein